MRYKFFIILLVIIVIIAISYFFITSSNTYKLKVQGPVLEQINIENSLGKQITVTGKYQGYTYTPLELCQPKNGFFLFEDDEGYRVKVCLKNAREMDAEKVYTIDGIVKFEKDTYYIAEV